MEIPLNVVIYCLVLGLALAGAARVRRVLSCIHPTTIRTAKKRPRRMIRPRWSCALARPIYVPLVERLLKSLPMWWGSTFWCPPLRKLQKTGTPRKGTPRSGPHRGKPPQAVHVHRQRPPALLPATRRRRPLRKITRSVCHCPVDRSGLAGRASLIRRSTDFTCRPLARWTGHFTGYRIN